MMYRSVRSRMIGLLGIVIVASMILASCATPTAAPAETQPPATAVPPTAVPPTAVPPTAVPPTEVPVPAGPTVGGTLVWGHTLEANTLDAQFAKGGSENYIASLLGATLIARAPTGEYVPWLATDWTVSEDGLVYTFNLRHDIKFQDGTALIAQDFVWSFNRLINPEVGTGFDLGPVQSIEAPDTYTLKITLAQPYFALLSTLADSHTQPLLQSWVEAHADNYGHNPLGVGPYKFKQWNAGEKVVLERNPDYVWAPPYSHSGPAYIEFIEFRFIQEYATLAAALEAGEVDFAVIEAKDKDLLAGTGMITILESIYNGLGPYMAMNCSVDPFDDIKVRQALNMAVDRRAMIQLIELGNAVPQYGPISPSVPGYWPGVEDLGARLYPYDPEGAKTLLNEAGWTDTDGDGVLDKDGKPLQFTLQTRAGDEEYIKTAEVLQQQYQAIGVKVDIQQEEVGNHINNALTGQFQATVFGYDQSEFDFLVLVYHSQMANLPKIQDAQLDDLLMKTRTTVDPAARQEYADQVQQRIVELALNVAIMGPKRFAAMNDRIKGYVWAPPGGYVSQGLYLDDAYIEQ